MIKFTQKQYGVTMKTIKECAPVASLGISTAALGVSGVNASTNVKRSRTDKEYQEKQIKAMKNLTRSLDNFDKDIKEQQNNISKDKPKKRVFKFFQKNNSKTTEYALKGAKIGAGVGIVGAGLLPKKLGFIEKKGDVIKENVPRTDANHWVIYEKDPKPNPGKDANTFKKDGYTMAKGTKILENQTIEEPIPGWDKGWKKKVSGIYNNSSDSAALRKAVAGVSSIAIGATLGAIVGMVYDVANFFDRKNVDKRLMSRVINDLKKMGFKEGQHFTTNPKTATFMKTKVCLGISRSVDTLKLLVNTVNDPKLSKLSQETTKNLPSMSTRAERVTDRFNDINITTASGQGDSTFVSSIAEKFIRAGYPVQLVEVG